MAKLLVTTLGPSQGIVLSKAGLGDAPEAISDAATIARRVIALPDRRQDVGAMILRQMIWRMHTRVGDGAATTAALAKAIFDEAYKLSIAGINPAIIQRGVRAAADKAKETLLGMAQQATTFEPLAAVGYTVTGHQKLGDILGEMVELLGAYGHIHVEDFLAPELDRVYQDGGRWTGEIASPFMITAPAARKAIGSNAHLALCAGGLVKHQ